MKKNNVIQTISTIFKKQKRIHYVNTQTYLGIASFLNVYKLSLIEKIYYNEDLKCLIFDVYPNLTCDSQNLNYLGQYAIKKDILVNVKVGNNGIVYFTNTLYIGDELSEDTFEFWELKIMESIYSIINEVKKVAEGSVFDFNAFEQLNKQKVKEEIKDVFLKRKVDGIKEILDHIAEDDDEDDNDDDEDDDDNDDNGDDIVFDNIDEDDDEDEDIEDDELTSKIDEILKDLEKKLERAKNTDDDSEE